MLLVINSLCGVFGMISVAACIGSIFIAFNSKDAHTVKGFLCLTFILAILSTTLIMSGYYLTEYNELINPPVAESVQREL